MCSGFSELEGLCEKMGLTGCGNGAGVNPKSETAKMVPLCSERGTTGAKERNRVVSATVPGDGGGTLADVHASWAAV